MMRKLEAVLLPVAIVALFAVAVGVLWISRQHAEVAAYDGYEPISDAELAAFSDAETQAEPPLPTFGPRPQMAETETQPTPAPLCITPIPA
jgi:hypothetical protein